MDPLAEKFPHKATYAYAENRPIDGINLEGKKWSKSTTSKSVKININFKIANSSSLSKKAFNKVVSDTEALVEEKLSGEVNGKSISTDIIFTPVNESEISKGIMGGIFFGEDYIILTGDGIPARDTEGVPTFVVGVNMDPRETDHVSIFGQVENIKANPTGKSIDPETVEEVTKDPIQIIFHEIMHVLGGNERHSDTSSDKYNGWLSKVYKCFT